MVKPNLLISFQVYSKAIHLHPSCLKNTGKIIDLIEPSKENLLKEGSTLEDLVEEIDITQDTLFNEHLEDMKNLVLTDKVIRCLELFKD